MAHLVWPRFEGIDNYIEPFFGSGAILLARPLPIAGCETVNDADGLLVNFWRAVKHEPEMVAHYADQPVFESDLHGRHHWLLKQIATMTPRLEGDHTFYDCEVAGYWVWGMCCWIAAGWCSGNGPWRVTEDGLLQKPQKNGAGAEDEEEVAEGDGIRRKLPHLSGDGVGITRGLPHLGGPGRGIVSPTLGGTAKTLGQPEPGIPRSMPYLSGAGMGVNSTIGGILQKLPPLAGIGQTLTDDLGRTRKERYQALVAWFTTLQDRLARVRVTAGDWSRIMGPAVTTGHGVTGVFLDPPYAADTGCDKSLYRMESNDVAHQVRKWAIENGDNPLFRIALCGYEGEHQLPDNWKCMAWNAGKGYAGRNEDNNNGKKERIWFSPHCLSDRQAALF